MFNMLNSCQNKIVVSILFHRQLNAFRVFKNLTELKVDHVFCRQLQTINSNEQVISLNTIDTLNNQIILNIKNRNKVFLKDVTDVLNLIENTNSINNRQGLLLLTCCTKLLTEQSPKERMQLAFRCWDVLRNHMNLNVNHYNAMIQCYIDNGEDIIASQFLDAMISKPNATTYKLLLKAICKLGYMNQATELMENMKSQNIEFDEDVTSLLIEGYGKQKDVDTVQKMKEEISSKNLMSSNTIVALLKTYFWNNCIDDALKLLNSHQDEKKFFFSEQQVFEILESALEYNRDDIFYLVLKLLPETTLTNTVISPYMQSMCTIFVYKGYPKMAYNVYKSLPLPVLNELDDESVYARIFIRECVKSDTPATDIINICEDLKNSNRNKYAFFVAYEAALHFYKEEIALNLLNIFKKQNHLLRPHYFWPLLVRSYKEKGEKGLLNILAIMNKMEVLIDEETILDYLLPNLLNFQQPENCVKQLQSCGVPVSLSILPILTVLLKENHLNEASDLCSKYTVKINSGKLLSPLLVSFMATKNTSSLLNILKFIHHNDSESKVKFLGNFLVNFLIKQNEDFENFEIIIKDCLENDYKISQMHADMCIERCSKSILDKNHLEKINGILTAVTDKNDTSLLPKKGGLNLLDYSQLLGHLNELEGKQMNTRGVLRTLLLASIQKSDFSRTSIIIKKIENEKVELSDGMKATIMDFYVKRNNMNCAEKYMKLLLQNPKFLIDGHKMVDYITLLAKHGKIEDVINFISTKSANCCFKNNTSLIPNVLNLINAVSVHGSVKYTEDVLNLLVKQRYCKISNVLLGPMIKIYLNRDDIEGAYKMFLKLNEKYKKTPLKHELLVKLLQMAYTSDFDDTDKSKLLKNVYFEMIDNVTTIIDKTHGTLDCQVSIILALADLCYEKQLTQYLNKLSRLPEDLLLKECNRIVDQKKSESLMTLAKSIQDYNDDLQHTNKMKFFELAMNVYRNTNDHQSALNLWKYLLSKKINPSKNIQQTLISVYKANNIDIPKDILQYNMNIH